MSKPKREGINYNKGDIRHFLTPKNTNNTQRRKQRANIEETKPTKASNPIGHQTQKVSDDSITTSNNSQNVNHDQHNSHNIQNTSNQSPKTPSDSDYKPSTNPSHISYKNNRNKYSPHSSSSEDDYNYNHYKLYPLPCKSSQRWHKILSMLSKPMKDSTDLIRALYQLAGEKEKSDLSCKGISALLNKMMSIDEQHTFYNITLPFIQECALRLPTLFPSREISLLYVGNVATIEFTEEQVASLLAMSFFGLNTWERGRTFPRFNITNLFGYTESIYLEKLKCILHYFYILAMESKTKQQNHDLNAPSNTRTISIYRHIPANYEYKIFQSQFLKENVTPLCPFTFNVFGSIEDCDNALQIDFANKYIGGGVLGSGCVQEEIRFLINPECIVSLLLCECMKANEAIAVIGTRQFAAYKGYGSAFEFNGNYNDESTIRSYDRYYKLRNCIVAIDAEKFFRNQRWQQYTESKMTRELIKCYTGFSIPILDTNLDETKESDNKLWIATGNWGCGVFGGDIQLKCIIQWMAASLAQRKLKYFAFGDTGCKYIESFVEIAQQNHVTVGMLWRYLCDYAKYKKNAYRHNPNNIESVFEFVVHQIAGNDKNIVLTARDVYRDKHDKNIALTARGCIRRQMSFDDSDLDIPSDNDDKIEKKKQLTQNSETQNSDNDDDDDGDCEMVQ